MFTSFSPQLIIYLAGAYPHEGDSLVRLKLSLQELATRDHQVMQAARARGVPMAIAMAGGYGKNIDDTVVAHLQTVRIAAHFCHQDLHVEANDMASLF